MTKNDVYLFATGMVNPFLKKSRKAVEIITSQEGFMAVHPHAPHGMLWVFDSLNNAKGARNVAELKPCPFCGGGADWFWDGINQRWQIHCEDCTAVVSCDGLEDAIEAWNRRCTDSLIAFRSQKRGCGCYKGCGKCGYKGRC